MNHVEKASKMFYDGYNCAQAVAVAFCDLTGLNEKTTAKMISTFGGGMGRLREVCGAVSGMLFVLGCLYGYDEFTDDEAKKQTYQQVQELAKAFQAQNGSVICREILKNPPTDPNPFPRTEEYYATRPCVRMVATAAKLMDDFIAKHPIK